MPETKKSKKEKEDYDFEFLYNKNAFNDVIGDPFALPEPIEGHYITLQKRSSVRVADNDFDIGKATRNSAQPNVMDFLCDVESLIGNYFEGSLTFQQQFIRTYITEEETCFDVKERVTIEQALGRYFRRYKLSPVSKYFQTIRQKKEFHNGSSTRTAKLSL